MCGFGNIQIFVLFLLCECWQIIDYVIGYQGLVYICFDGKVLLELYDESYCFVLGVIVMLREGDDIVLVVIGLMVYEIVDVVQMLVDVGIQVKVVSVLFFCFCDIVVLLVVLKLCKVVIMVEEYNVNGGLGSLVVEVLVEVGVGILFKCLGILDGEYVVVVDCGWLCKYYGFDVVFVVELVQKMC